MHAVSEVQDSVASALLDVAAPVPYSIRGARRGRAGRRFDVYRRTVATRLTDRLVANFPVTRQMIGEDLFAALARSYAVKFPPNSPVLLNYGDLLPRFIRRLGGAPSIEYLADVAELEAAHCRAYHAADAIPVAPERLAQAMSAFSGLAMRLHPSASLVELRFPVVSIWEANLRGDDAPIQWRPEAALICRPDLDVQVRRLPRGAYAFLTEIMNGTEVAAAAQRTTMEVADFDLDGTLAFLSMANACVGLHKVSLLAA